MLNRIFVYYTSFGDPLNQTHLRSNKFIKFLKEAGLLPGNDDLTSSRAMALRNSMSRDKFTQNQFYVAVSNMTITKVQADLMFKKATGIGNPQVQ